MPRNTRRPVYLNLFKIRLPVAGWLSIFHRATGVLLFLATPFLIYLLQLSLTGPAGFDAANQLLHSPLVSLIVVVLLWSICHHLLAGLRYLMLDIDIGLEHPAYVYSSWTVLVAAPVFAVLLAVSLL